MSRRKRKYHLYVIPRKGHRYGVELREVSNGSDEAAVERIWGPALEGTLDHVIQAVKSSGNRASALRPGRKEPFVLDEETGVRLGLLFLAAKPLRKPTRIDDVSHETASLSTEEAYYWFSRCTDTDVGRRARRALRILMAEE